MEELHDIVDSLFELAPSLDEELQKLRTPTDFGLLPVTNSYRNIIRDKFPNAGGQLILRFAEGNSMCHQQLRSQADEKPPIFNSNTGLAEIEEAQEIPQDLVEEHVKANVNDSHPAASSQIGGNVLAPSWHDSGLGSSRPAATRASEKAPVNDLYPSMPPRTGNIVQAAPPNDPGLGSSWPPTTQTNEKFPSNELYPAMADNSGQATTLNEPGYRSLEPLILPASDKTLIDLNTTTLPEIESYVQGKDLHDSRIDNSQPSAAPKNVNFLVDYSGSIKASEIKDGVEASPHQNSSSRPGTSRPPGSFLAPPPSSAALSVYTAFSTTSAMGNRPCTPRMPKDSSSKFGFKCPVCSLHQKPISNKIQWRYDKHFLLWMLPGIDIF